MMNIYIKYKLLFLLAGFLSLPITAQEDLEDYLQVAASNNPGVQAAYAQFEAALQKSPQVSSLPDPTLTVSAFGRMMESSMGAEEAVFSLMQMFPWFGTLEARGNVADLMAEAQFQNYLDVRNKLFFEVKSAYAQLYEVEKTIELQEENLEILDSYKDLSLSRFSSGGGQMVDVVRIDIQKEGALTAIEVLRDQLEPLEADFNLMLNRSPELPVQIADTLVFNWNESQLDPVLKDHPAVQQFESQKRAYEAQQELARKEGMPMLGLGLDYTIMSKTPMGMPEMNGDDAFMPMLSVSLPIFRKKYKAIRKEAEFMTTAMEQEGQRQQNELRSQYELSLFELKKAETLIDLYNRQIESSEQARSLLISAYSTATGNFDEVLRMNQDIIMLKTQRLNAIRSGVTAQARMDYLSSKTE